jgi:hypothetical protein
LVGPLADASLQGLNLDLAIVGVDGISSQGGITTYDMVEARTNRAMIDRARKVIVVADGSKVGRMAFAQICQLDLLRLYDAAEMTAAGAEQLRRAHRALELAGAPRDPPARAAARSSAAGSPHQPNTGPRRGSPISPKAQKRTTVSPPRWLLREPPPLCPQPTIVEPNGEAKAAAVDSESAADEPALAQRVWI